METVKFKNKFTKYRYPLKKRWGIYLSNFILELVAKLPKFQGGLIHRLQIINEHRKRNNLNVVKPREIGFEFLHVWVCETFPIEDISKLRHGLKGLFGDFSKTRFIIPFLKDKEELNRIIDDIEDSVLKASWYNVGSIDVLSNNDRLESKREWIDDINVEIHHFYSSFVTVCFGVEPSKTFKSIINNLLAEDIPARIIFGFPRNLKGFKRWLYFPAYSKTFATNVKREVIEDLMLEFKFEVVRIISKYFQGLFHKTGLPLPSVELFCENAFVPKRNNNNQAEQEKKSFIFWDSLGMSKKGLDHFDNEEAGYSIFVSNQSIENSIERPYKILIEKSKVQSGSIDGNFNDKIIHNTNYYLEVLTPIIITQEIIHNLLKESILIKKSIFSINTIINKQIPFKRIPLAKLISLKQRINTLYTFF